MKIVVDASAVIAVITNEKHKEKLVAITKGADLLAPSSLHWEIGNAFSAMFKRGRISLEQAMRAIDSYAEIPLRFSDIELSTAVEIAERLNIYAYDAYVIGCASKHKAPLVSLDQGLIEAAAKMGVKAREVSL